MLLNINKSGYVYKVEIVTTQREVYFNLFWIFIFLIQELRLRKMEAFSKLGLEHRFERLRRAYINFFETS